MHVYSIRVCLNEEKLHEGGTRFQKSHTSATCSGFPPVQVTPCWRMPYLWLESHEESIWWYICRWMVLVALHASLDFKNKLMKRQVRATPFQWCVVSLKQTNSHANHLLPWLQSTLQWYAPSTSCFWYWEKRPFNYEIRWCDCWKTSIYVADVEIWSTRFIGPRNSTSLEDREGKLKLKAQVIVCCGSCNYGGTELNAHCWAHDVKLWEEKGFLSYVYHWKESWEEQSFLSYANLKYLWKERKSRDREAGGYL